MNVTQAVMRCLLFDSTQTLAVERISLSLCKARFDAEKPTPGEFP
jgi:hypothetical protein